MPSKAEKELFVEQILPIDLRLETFELKIQNLTNLFESYVRRFDSKSVVKNHLPNVKNILQFLKITYHKKEYKCIHNCLVSQSTKLYVVYFLNPKYLDHSVTFMQGSPQVLLYIDAGLRGRAVFLMACSFVSCRPSWA